MTYANIDDEDLDEVYIDCLDCKWVLDTVDDIAVCVAFPSGIPLEILDGTRNHRTPIDGDNGIRFERIENPEKNQGGSNTI